MFNTNTRKIYMIGIKGTGMSSLAVLLKKLGYEVSGSDTSEHFFTESQLTGNDILFYNGFEGSRLADLKSDLVIVSTAYNERNPEVSQAKLLRTPMISYPEAVGEISKQLTSVAVSGSHGKTTTTSMLGAIMQTNGKTVTLAGTVAEALNTTVDKPEFFVFEADEYQNKFQYYSPANVIVTNIDFDHPDYFRDMAHYTETYKTFLERTLLEKGFVLFNYDDQNTRNLLNQMRGNIASYGFDPETDYYLMDVSEKLNAFTIRHNYQDLLHVELQVYGKHNILNAAASAIMALRLGITPESIQKALKEFRGVKRRMEMIPSNRYIIIDDYGHHPTEIQATLRALRNHYRDKNIVTVFHPHTFTRTQALLKEFGASFKDADLTLVLDIYPSAREATGTIHAKDLIKEIESHNSKAVYTPSIPDAAEYIKTNIQEGSVILTIGAGDVWKLCDLIK